MDSQGFQCGFQRVSSCSAWCCYCSRRRGTQMHPRESVQSESQFSDQPLHGLHSKLQSNTMNIEDFTVKHALHKQCLSWFQKLYFRGDAFLCTLFIWLLMLSLVLRTFSQTSHCRPGCVMWNASTCLDMSPLSLNSLPQSRHRHTDRPETSTTLVMCGAIKASR